MAYQNELVGGGRFEVYWFFADLNIYFFLDGVTSALHRAASLPNQAPDTLLFQAKLTNPDFGLPLSLTHCHWYGFSMLES